MGCLVCYDLNVGARKAPKGIFEGDGLFLWMLLGVDTRMEERKGKEERKEERKRKKGLAGIPPILSTTAYM